MDELLAPFVRWLVENPHVSTTSEFLASGACHHSDKFQNLTEDSGPQIFVKQR